MHAHTRTAVRPKNTTPFNPLQTPDCVETFICQNQGLINGIVNRNYVPEADKEDLYQEACLAVKEAFESYDSNFGAKFTTHYYWSASHRIIQYRRNLERNPACEVHGYVKSAIQVNQLTADSPVEDVSVDNLKSKSKDQPYEQTEVKILIESLPKRMETLTEREREAISNVFFLENSATESAKIMGVSVSRVSALIKSASIKMAS